jgi:acetyl esterase/lipase
MKSRLAVSAAFAIALASSATEAHTYGPYSQETFVVYAPTAGTASHAMVYIHGGAWAGGCNNCSEDGYLANLLAQDGLLVVSIDYRYTATAPWPAQLLDAQMAIRYVRATYNLPTCVVGTSAGAQIALMTGLSPAITAPAVDPSNEAAMLSTESTMPDCVVSWSAPIDIPELMTYSKSTNDANVVRAIINLSHGSKLPAHTITAEASPLMQSSMSDSPATMLIHGQADPLIPVRQAEEYFAALTASRVQSGVDQLVITPGQHVLRKLTRQQDAAYAQQIAVFVGQAIDSSRWSGLRYGFDERSGLPVYPH